MTIFSAILTSRNDCRSSCFCSTSRGQEENAIHFSTPLQQSNTHQILIHILLATQPKGSTRCLSFSRVCVILHGWPPPHSVLGLLDSGMKISQYALIGCFSLSHARPSFLNNLVAATPLAFLVAATGSRVNLRSGKTEVILQAIRLDGVYALFVVGCTNSQVRNL